MSDQARGYTASEAADRIAELKAANAKMRKCLESIAAYHDERLSEVIPYGYNDETAMDTHKHCRDFARGGLK